MQTYLFFCFKSLVPKVLRVSDNALPYEVVGMNLVATAEPLGDPSQDWLLAAMGRVPAGNIQREHPEIEDSNLEKQNLWKPSKGLLFIKVYYF